jgi:hypothetical protein
MVVSKMYTIKEEVLAFGKSVWFDVISTPSYCDACKVARQLSTLGARHRVEKEDGTVLRLFQEGCIVCQREETLPDAAFKQ